MCSPWQTCLASGDMRSGDLGQETSEAAAARFRRCVGLVQGDGLAATEWGDAVNVVRGTVVLKETRVPVPGDVEGARTALPSGVTAAHSSAGVGAEAGAGGGGAPPAIDPAAPAKAVIWSRATGPYGSLEVKYDVARHCGVAWPGKKHGKHAAARRRPHPRGPSCHARRLGGH